MANIKISQLTAKGEPLAPDDLVEISKSLGGGLYETRSVTGANILSSKQDTLSSGINIKTVEGQNILGTGNIEITKTDIGLANVDNTSDANKPISTATQAALNAKQNTIANSDSITQGATNLFLTTAERTKLTNTSGTNTGDQTNITGNAATVTTNANLTGVVTSTGNTTAIANGAISNAMLANGAVANLSGTNTGDNATNSQYSGLVSNATHTGDATGNVGLTVKGINGTLLSTLGTGILKNTTTTGVPSIAVAADFPTLNQNTTGTAANVTGIVALANGGTGTATPSLVAGTNINITGTFPNQTITATGTAGAVTQIVAGTNVTVSPAGGTGVVTINSSGGGGGATCLQSMVFTNSVFGFRTSNAMSASSNQNHNISSAGMNYTPYIPNETFTCVEFSINVSVAQATGLGRICVYSSNNNLPTNLLYSSTDLNCSTTGTKSVISSFVFTKGTTYWLAIQTNVNNINVTGLSGDSSIPLCHFATGGAITCWVQVNLTYASGAPSVAGINSFLLTTSPQILMKK